MNSPRSYSSTSPREPLSYEVDRAPEETTARIIAEELHNTPDLEVGELRAQLQAAEERAAAADALSAVRTRDMDRLLRHQSRNADSLRAMSNALISFTAHFRNTALAQFDEEESPSAVREARELESHVDNLTEVLAATAESISAPEMVKNSTPVPVEAKPTVTTVAEVVTPAVPTTSSMGSRTQSVESVASSTLSQASGELLVSPAGTPPSSTPQGGARPKVFKAPAPVKALVKKKPSATVTSSSSITDDEASFVLASTSPPPSSESQPALGSPAPAATGSADSSRASQRHSKIPVPRKSPSTSRGVTPEPMDQQ
jgi:hypothetical protein